MADAHDPDHELARAWFEQNALPLVTTDYIFDETLTLIRMELGHRAAIAFGQSLRASRLTQLVSVSQEDRESAWQIFQSYADQKFSFTDCTSFAIMKRLGLSLALTMDKHFRVMGFSLAT